MVKIVTGKINSFKSTRLRQYYEHIRMGDGFIAEKVMSGKIVHSYHLVKLSTGKKTPFIIRNQYDDGSYKVQYKIGPYHIFESAIKYVEHEINQMIEDKIHPIFLDEISLLELEGKGFCQILKKLLSLKKDICMVVREDLLEAVLDKFSINEYEIIGD
ncbi:hypothetical protein KHQ88_02940 [Mycoplasmatota bacterium]|nr:hypothetical protein KHQ88_02940 [Mycoplasmatota bacterium]